MKACKRIICLILALVMAATVPVFAFAEAADTEEETTLSLGTVANVYFLISHANPEMPHIWIYIENTSNETLMVGHYPLPAGETVSIGGWRDRGNGAGIYYNLERYWVKDATYTRTNYVMTTATKSEIAMVTTTMEHHDYWSWAFNCGWLATSIWNKCTIRFIPYLFYPELMESWMMMVGGKAIDFKLKKLNNPNKVYKQTDDGLEVVVSGALWTSTGV